MALITLTTDFGTTDGYAGIMKGVILSIAPGTSLVDLTHEIAPQDIRAAAFVLQSACPYFPRGTIHVVVVDPGVGTERRALAVRTAQAMYVGPDNGVLSWAWQEQRIETMVSLTQPAYWLPEISRTFHGRDVFGPVAGHLARGLPVEQLGAPVADPVVLPLPRPSRGADGAIHSEVIYIDRFGNLVTGIRVQSRDLRILNLPPEEGRRALDQAATIEILGRQLHPLERTYGAVASGQAVALIGSSGYLEIAVRDGSAAALLQAHIGDAVDITFNEVTGR